MSYSPGRLERAQQVFEHSMSKFCMLPHLAGPYHLRERALKRAAVVGSWHDNDKDKDYQPSSKRTPTKRKLSLFHEDYHGPRSDKRARSLSPISIFRSRMSAGTESEYYVPPWTPSQHSEPDSWDRYWTVNPEIDTPNSQYGLQTYNDDVLPESPQTNDTTEVEAEASESTGDVLPPDSELRLRECAACQELGFECSLKSNPDPFAYPCTICEIDDVFCVVSPPPKWKQTCECCKGQNKEICSYRYADYDHSQPCLPCRNHGFECVAGPARHAPFALLATSEPSEPSSSPVYSPAPSNSTDGTPEPDVSEVSKPSEQLSSPIQPKTQIPEINPTKGNSWETSSPLFSSAHPSVAEGPKPHEVIVITDSDDETPNTPKRQGSPIYISDSLESPTRTTPSNTIPSQYANTHRIWTELAHPVVFLANEQDEDPPCHWCNNFAYGITGLGPRNPEVCTLDNGTIIELQDGHIAEGKEQSRMCVFCTWNRCKIIQCSHDTLHLLPVPLSTKDQMRTDAAALLEEASEALTDPETGKAGPVFRTSPYQWCSLCREPAFGSCQAVQPVNVYAEVVDCDEESRGCGLMLCDCCLDLTMRFKGDLNAVAAWGRSDPSNLIPYRADVELILSGAENNTMYRLYVEER